MSLDGIDDLEFVDENYYISPSLDTLATLSKYEIQKVENLVVGNKQYGKIEFLDPVDLSDIPLGSICDDLVVFQPMSVLLYNNSTNVPEKGKGLNVRARISCYNCYPLDKSTRKPIKDPNHRIMERYSEKLKKIPHTHFESYDPASGTYCFTVDHALEGHHHHHH
uniref:Nucleoporin NUP116 n=1 Tax=Candida glabrata TaxID=5478 RepID=UPI0001DD3782